MKENQHTLSRRTFLKGSAAAVGLGAFSTLHFKTVFADDFPSRDINVLVATGEGGAADRVLRSFTSVWKKYLNIDFRPEFYPGAAGQVGYEIYLGRRDPDCYNLLYGNMGPETIMYVLQKPKYKFPDDYVYFCQTDLDPTVVFVRAGSPFKTIQDLVAEGKKRTVTLSTSRLPHPASIAILSLGEATGAKFNLIPYGGGNPTMMACITGEVDASTLPMANTVAMGGQVRTLGVFSKKNPLPDVSNNAPTVNDVFGTKIPELPSARAFAIHTKAIEKYPDRFKKLNETMRKVFDDPEFKTVYEKTGRPWQFVDYADQAGCMQYAQYMYDLAERYKPLLTAKKKKK
jgi:tripartite-type tricarboxylate transporter receptor subunit TctC